MKSLGRVFRLQNCASDRKLKIIVGTGFKCNAHLKMLHFALAKKFCVFGPDMKKLLSQAGAEEADEKWWNFVLGKK